MTYYQCASQRTGKTAPFDKKTCANKSVKLERGELFVTYKDGLITAYDAKHCPFCGAVFTETFFDPNATNIENAHFLADGRQD